MYIYPYTYIHMNTYIHIYIYTYVHIYIYTYIHIYIYVYIHIYIYTYIHIVVLIKMSSYIHKVSDLTGIHLRESRWFARALTANFSAPKSRSKFASFFDPFQVRFGLDFAPQNGAKTVSKRVPKPS